MKAWIVPGSLLEGHWPVPFVAARSHLRENRVSHGPKSSVPPLTFAALAFTFNRQAQYFPAALSAVFSLVDSHLPVPVLPRALTASSRTAANAVTTLGIAVAFIASSNFRTCRRPPV